ncbi:hypothetical protein D9M68_978980 [compost metagenome]
MRRDKVELGTPVTSAAPRKLLAFTTSTKRAMSFRYSVLIAPILDQRIPDNHLYLTVGLIEDAFFFSATHAFKPAQTV